MSKPVGQLVNVTSRISRAMPKIQVSNIFEPLYADNLRCYYSNLERENTIEIINYAPTRQFNIKPLNRLSMDTELVIKNGINGSSNNNFMRVGGDNGRYFMGVNYEQNTNDYWSVNALSYQGNILSKAIEPCLQRQDNYLLSATCLFSTQAAVGITDKDQKINMCLYSDTKNATIEKNGVISELYFQDDLTAQEMLTAIDRQNCFSNFDGDKINFEIPTTAYKLYGLELYQRGLMCPDTYREWSNAVDIRGQRLLELEQSLSDKTIISVDPLDMLLPLLDKKLPPSLCQVYDVLKNDDSWWVSYLALEPNVSLPSIAFASYVKQQINALAENSNKNIIVVDKPDEDILVSKVAMSIKKLGLPSSNTGVLVGIYPFGQLGIVQDNFLDNKSIIFEKYRQPFAFKQQEVFAALTANKNLLNKSLNLDECFARPAQIIV